MLPMGVNHGLKAGSLAAVQAGGRVGSRNANSISWRVRGLMIALLNLVLVYLVWQLVPRWVQVSYTKVHSPLATEDPPPLMAHGATQDQMITPEISALVKKLMTRSNLPGVSVAAVRLILENQAPAEVEFGSWGFMSESGANVTADTLFNIGSCSKAFLALGMGLLMDDFRLGRNRTVLPAWIPEFTWDTRISDLLSVDEWALTDGWATKEANVGDILSHVSGLPRHDFAWYGEDSTLDVIRRLRHLKMTHGLRMKWDYNNQMYVLGSHIIARYAGVPYTSFASERIFKTLGMDSTTFDAVNAERSGNLSHSWSSTARRIPLWLNLNGTDWEMLSGPGGVISSARDMSKWIISLLPSVTDVRPAFPHSILTDVTEVRAIMVGRSLASGISMVGYGMGWMRMSYLGHEIVYHSGSIPGFKAIVILLPREGAGVVSLVNGDDNLMVHQLTAFNIVHSILGLPLLPEPPQDAWTALQEGILPSPADFHGYYEDTTGTTNHTPMDVPVEVPLNALAGTYWNRGYGNVTLCAPSTASPYCDRVHAAFARVHNASHIPVLLAEWPRLLATHMKLEPRTRDVLWMTPHYIFPEGFGADRTPFDYELFPPGYGMYVKCAFGDTFTEGSGEVQGCGLFLTWETFAGRKPWVPLRDQAEVWFEKVG